MEVDRVEERPPDVVLVLIPRRVPDPHGLGVVVPGEVIQRRLGKFGFPAHSVDDVQRFALADLVGDEIEEAVRLEVEAQRVQTP